jgi:hypothetical protein
LKSEAFSTYMGELLLPILTKEELLAPVPDP